MMIALLSPAKSIKTDGIPKVKNLSCPDFKSESEVLMSLLQKMKTPAIAKLMDLSSELAELNYQRYRNWESPDLKNGAKPVVMLFTGEVYRALQASDFNQAELDFAQKQLRILSGLHGLLRPLDVVFPYRLEMGTALKNKKGSNLYHFWGNKISEKLNSELSEKDTLINLASTEYFKAVKVKELKPRLIHCDFKDFKNGKYISVMTFAKQARGLMARFIVKNRITQPAKLKLFDSNGYGFNESLSDEEHFVFTRG